METKEMSIKLMIDTESNRLIFAEASKDFVDFLIYLLSLPIGIVTKLLTSESMVGSIANVYTSVTNLDETYLLPNVHKHVILSPMFLSSAINTPLSLTGSSLNSSRYFYTCWDPDCKRGITNTNEHVYCPGCHGIMNQEIKFIDKDSEGYVHNVASYMISDDLSITSISTMSIVSMLNKFNVTKPEERVVKIGSEEALELLKASLKSTTVLTDVFLNKKKRKHDTVGLNDPVNEVPGVDNDRSNKITIFVRNAYRTYTFNEVDLSDTIHKLKVRLNVLGGIPLKDMCLLKNTTRLEDKRTLADYNIQNESTLYVFKL